MIREILVIKGLLELLQAHQADQDLAGHRGVESQEAPPWNMALLSDRLMNLTNVLLPDAIAFLQPRIVGILLRNAAS